MTENVTSYWNQFVKNRAGQKAFNFQSAIELSEYSELEYLDNSVTRPEVAFCRLFPW
ncbi:MAG: hypothetical protein LKF37_08770 [Lentilactobacillus diolivorans]|jgi:hypothetical protein|nr:hypothetical protein [Lentilactobacillus diolivorans]